MKRKAWNTKRSLGVSFGDRNPLGSNTEEKEKGKRKKKRRNLELRQMKKKINGGNNQSFNNHREIPQKRSLYNECSYYPHNPKSSNS